MFILQEKVNDKTKKKWRLWRSSSEGYGSSSKRSHLAASESSDSDDAFGAAMATVVRALPKDFRLIRQEWAAIRIQTAFRGLLVIGFFFSFCFMRFLELIFNYVCNCVRFLFNLILYHLFWFRTVTFRCVEIVSVIGICIEKKILYNYNFWNFVI